MTISLLLLCAGSLCASVAAHTIPDHRLVSRSNNVTTASSEVVLLPTWFGHIDFKTDLTGSHFATCDDVPYPGRFYEAKNDGCTAKSSPESADVACIFPQNSCAKSARACYRYGGKFAGINCLEEPQMPEWRREVTFVFNGTKIGVCSAIRDFALYEDGNDWCTSKSVTSSFLCEAPDGSCESVEEGCRMYEGKVSSRKCRYKVLLAGGIFGRE